MAINLNRVEFVKSAASKSGFIRDGRPSIVFAGKSNVGKSSVINRLLNRKTSRAWALSRERPYTSTTST